MVTMDPTARRVYDSGELVNFLAIDAARTGDGLVPNLHWRTWFVQAYSACVTSPALVRLWLTLPCLFCSVQGAGHDPWHVHLHAVAAAGVRVPCGTSSNDWLHTRVDLVLQGLHGSYISECSAYRLTAG